MSDSAGGPVSPGWGGELHSRHRVWGKGWSAHTDPRGWREGKRKHIFAAPAQDFLKAGLPVPC